MKFTAKNSRLLKCSTIPNASQGAVEEEEVEAEEEKEKEEDEEEEEEDGKRVSE